MRDENGVFVGLHICSHWRGIDRYEDRECCGGRKFKVAYSRCDLKGVVEAEMLCCSVCKSRDWAGKKRDFSK